MHIDSYHFGSITIDGEIFTKDVVLAPPKVLSPWWRREGHRLDLADLAEVNAYAPAVLVIGTGSHGAMRVPNETLAGLQAAGITVEVHRSTTAVTRFNELVEAGRRVAAAIHLTC